MTAKRGWSDAKNFKEQNLIRRPNFWAALGFPKMLSDPISHSKRHTFQSENKSSLFCHVTKVEVAFRPRKISNNFCRWWLCLSNLGIILLFQSFAPELSLLTLSMDQLENSVWETITLVLVYWWVGSIHTFFLGIILGA